MIIRRMPATRTIGCVLLREDGGGGGDVYVTGVVCGGLRAFRMRTISDEFAWSCSVPLARSICSIIISMGRRDDDSGSAAVALATRAETSFCVSSRGSVSEENRSMVGRLRTGAFAKVDKEDIIRELLNSAFSYGRSSVIFFS